MKIVTDSAADLTPEDILSNEIKVAPLYIQFPEGEVSSGDLTPDAFYDRLEAMQPQVPTTAQPSPEVFAALYTEALAGAGEILSLHISSGLSGTFNAARLGAEQAGKDRIHLIDSMTLSGGQRFQLLAAAKAIRAGWSFDAILERVEEVRAQTEVVYTLETLDYLLRGGRIGRVQALASSLLNIKPVIHVEKTDGKYSTLKKSRTISRAVKDLTTHLETLYGDGGPLWVSILHGRYEKWAGRLAEQIQARLPVEKIEILRISPVLGVHTGPGIVGAAVVPMELIAGIA